MRGVMLAVAVLAAPALGPAADNAPVLGSKAVSWEEIEAARAPGKRGSQIFRHPTATLDELEMHVTTLPAGLEAHPPHQHPDEEIIVVKEGTVDALVGGETRRLGPGSVIFQAANQPHTLRNVGDSPAVYHVIRWNSPGMLKRKGAPAGGAPSPSSRD